MQDETTFTDELEGWLRSDRPKTIGSLGDVFAEKSFAVTILLLMALPALPLPTGGVTHVLEAIAVLVAAQMVMGRDTLWIPRRWQDRDLGELATDRVLPRLVGWIRRLEGLSRPRGVALFRHRSALRVYGIILAALAIAAALAPPFSGLDTLPALGAVAIALAIIVEDVVILAIGLVIGAGGTLLILTIGAAVVRFVHHLL